MKMPADRHGNPALQDEADRNDIAEVEYWCRQYGVYKCGNTALERFNIGVYQIGQALSYKSKMANRESVGACILHMIIALTKVGGRITPHLQRLFVQEDYVYDPETLLLSICKATMLFFYKDFAPIKSYRKKKYRKRSLEKEIVTIIKNVGGLTIRSHIPRGIEEAAEVLLKGAFKE